MRELCGCLSLRPLTSRHICDMPVRLWHLSTANSHLVRLFTITSLRICLFRSLSVSTAGFSPRFRYRSSACDLADAGMVDWKCSMRPAGMKTLLALFTFFLKVFSVCSTFFVSPSSARYLLQASALSSKSAFLKLMQVRRGPSIVDSSELIVIRMVK